MKVLGAELVGSAEAGGELLQEFPEAGFLELRRPHAGTFEDTAPEIVKAPSCIEPDDEPQDEAEERQPAPPQACKARHGGHRCRPDHHLLHRKRNPPRQPRQSRRRTRIYLSGINIRPRPVRAHKCDAAERGYRGYRRLRRLFHLLFP